MVQGFRVHSSEVWGIGYMVQGVGFRVNVLGLSSRFRV
jgi:hypothetical protein